MKIDLITLQAVNNYGSVLQTFATQEFFRQFGCEVRVINYLRSTSNNGQILLNVIKRNISTLPAKVMYRFFLQKRVNAVFDSFRREYLNMSGEKLYRSLADFEGYESDADAFCTGSDQVWNSFWNSGILPELYLAFVPEGKYRFAFSASFGKTEIEPEEVQDTQKYIDAYKHISVREDSAVKILKEQYHYNNAVHVLDPTLCLSGNTWRKYVENTNGGGALRNEPYILVYNAYGTTRDFDSYAEAFSQKTGLKLVELYTSSGDFFTNIFRHKHLIRPSSVFEFLALIDNARCIITDSFHGTAFALNLNTEPVCIFPKRFSGRLESILRLTGTLDRRVRSMDDFSVMDRPVDFGHVNSVLDCERRKVSNWLNMVLAEIREHNAKKEAHP